MNKGFTLIEILLYTVIFAIVGTLTTAILLTVTQVQQRESASAEVTGQLNFLMQKIQYLVRESSNIEITAGVTTSTLKLRMKDSTKDPTCLSLVNGVIKLAEGPADPQNPINCTTNTSDLTNDRVIVDTLNFKKFTQYPGHDTLSLDIQMTYNSQNPKSRVQRTLSSAIARVSAATFDSDVVPGSSYTYSLGQAGAPWQNIYMKDGSAASPSYTFANNTGLGFFRAGTNILGFTTAGSERMRIDASGNVGIGTTGPTYQLQLSTDSAGKPNGGSWANSSDERVKTKINPITGALDKITSLQGVNFEWKNPDEHSAKNNETRAGFIAQDVEKVFPQFISEIDASGKDKELTPDGKIKSLTLPFDFDAYLVEAIKELKAENEALKKRIEVLETR